MNKPWTILAISIISMTVGWASGDIMAKSDALEHYRNGWHDGAKSQYDDDGWWLNQLKDCSTHK